MMREILFLSHRIPFPPDRGDKIRSHHILHRLARIAPVHVATFADDDYDMAEEVELASLAASYKLVRRSKPLVLAGMEALAKGLPVSLTAFHDRSLDAYVRDVLATRNIAVIYVFSGQMGRYVPSDFAGRVIADFVDVDSAKFEAYSAREKGLVGWVQAREGRLLKSEEIRLAQRADISLLVSQAEADLFRARLPDEVRDDVDVRALGNGIDSDSFNPDVIAPEMRMFDCPGPRIVFTGQMDYLPNVHAALRAIESIMPLIRQEVPSATFHVVGRNAGPALLAHHEREGCYVWGRVPDIRSWLKAADLALIPLDIARGVQNKVLEAMSMALPVVLTSQAATGIGAANGMECTIVDSDEALANASIALLKNARRAQTKGAAARRFVVENASWHSVLAPLPDILGLVPLRVRNAA